MPDRTFTYTIEVTVNADDRSFANARTRADAAINLWLNATAYRSRILGVTEGEERTWADDCQAAEAADRDDNRAITETELFNGHGIDWVDDHVRTRPVPHALRRDVLGGER